MLLLRKKKEVNDNVYQDEVAITLTEERIIFQNY